MARSRNIKPGFFKNEYLAQLPPLTRLLFQALWCEADREGRLEDRPLRIKAEYFPYDDCDVNTMLAQLQHSAGNFLTRYEVDGNRYIQISKFVKHQNPHVKEPKSIIPPVSQGIEIPKVCASTIPASCKHRSCLVLAGLIPDSLLLIPDSPFPIKPFDQNLDFDRIDDANPFDKFWTAYPRKVGKGAAQKAWKKIKSPSATVNLIVESLAWQIESDQWQKNNGEYIPHPATYLNQRRWEDEKPIDTLDMVFGRE